MRFFRRIREQIALSLSLFFIIFVSGVASVAEAEGPPVAEGAIPSAYVWLGGGAVAIGIGYTWGHGTLYFSKDQKQEIRGSSGPVK